MITVYAYAGCDTCRKALKWLQARGIAHEVRAIRETPPTVAELRTALMAADGELRRLFNVSGQDYRALQLKDKLPVMRVEAALALLAQNGNLVKRPMVVGGGVALNGFDEAAWTQALLR